ncbi:MAG TPA: endolytic transglycosylase MltG, partial [Spirochaetaceae bacterium]|nr:endolytic transglycosylase MltG [Spirochaetaceae bacterium]
MNTTKKSKAAAFGALFLFLLILIAGALVAVSVLMSRLDSTASALASESALFKVAQGESASAITRRLLEGGYIRSELYFRLMLKAKGLESALKAGSYEFKAGLRTSDIIELLASGKQRLVRFSVAEGSGIRAVAEAAERAGIATEEAFLAAAYDAELLRELGVPGSSFLGYLYPDTYFLPDEAGAEALIRLMVATFRTKLAALAPSSSSLSAEEVRRYVVLASVVEREYRIPEEAPLMAGVFWNRLRIGMALQSCATVVYVITERQGKPHPSRIFDRDLQINDPFNTYQFPGLPP